MMDPLGAKADTTDGVSLAAWITTEVPATPQFSELRFSPFPWSDDVNSRVCLWSGNITQLSVDAIVNSTNEMLCDRNYTSEQIMRAAGSRLRTECNQIRVCKTGEAKMTKGFNLPCRYVIHTVSPRYNVKYRTAAENALYSCYRAVLQCAKENQIRIVAIPPINIPQRGYPPEEGAHIALRTVRRFLEHDTGSTIEKIVFVVSGIDEEVYRNLMPRYFPRCELEEQFVIDYIPDDIGNEFGEPVIEERKIRILSKPTAAEQSDDSSDDHSEADQRWMNASSKVGFNEFSSMHGDHDTTRRYQLQTNNSKEQHRAVQLRRYKRWLKRARTSDLSDIASYQALYQSGFDRYGRPIVVFIGRNFPAATVNMEKAFLYFIHLLDSVVNKDYVIVYFHTQTTADNRPELGVLRELYNIVDQRYRKNLRSFYIVHPTLWSRLVTWFFTTFTASSIKDKVHMIHSLEMLHQVLREDIDIPPSIIDYDFEVNGTTYSSPVSSNAQSADGL